MDVTHLRGVRLRWLLVLIVLLAAVPIFALHVSRLQTTSETATNRAYEDAAVLATSGVAAHEQELIQARQLLEVLAEIPVVRSAALPECTKLLHSVRQGRSWAIGIQVFDRRGAAVCVSNSSPRSWDLGDTEYFKQARVSGRYVVSDVIGDDSGSPRVSALLPLQDERGEFQGAMGIEVSLNWINQVAAEASSRFGGLLIVFDRAGRIVAYRSEVENAAAPGMLTDLPDVGRHIGESRGTFAAVDAEGVRRLFGVSRFSDSGIAVAVGLDRAKVLGPIDWSFRQALLLLVSVAAGSIGLALLVAEFGLMRGVRALKSAALRLKAGKMGLRVHLPASVAAELHDLAATYNAMTAEFERLAYLDRLTGLPNRRYLERHVARRGGREEKAAAGRNAVLAIDIDGFKPVNDTHGHAVGDRVLALIARRIASAVDERGILFRVGGDEFVAVVPLAKAQGREMARLIGEDVRQAMEQAIELDGLSFAVACSIGVALVPDDAKTLAGALTIADAALYEAKRTGRNRVVDSAPSVVADLPGSDPGASRHRHSHMSLGAPW